MSTCSLYGPEAAFRKEDVIPRWTPDPAQGG